MKRIIQSLIFLTLFIVLWAGVQAGSVIFEVKASYFVPTEKAFNDIYGSGLMYGGEITVGIWKNLDIWAGGSYFSKYGELSYTGEETHLQIVPLGGGIKYRFTSGILNFYGGAGVNYFDYAESNIIGDVHDGAVGFVTKIGVYLAPVPQLVFDFFAEYSYCQMTPADFTINIGGIKAGVGMGVRL